MVKFEKKWALIGMAFCVLLNILSAIGVVPIGGLQRGSFGGATFFLIVYFVVNNKKEKNRLRYFIKMVYCMEFLFSSFS